MHINASMIACPNIDLAFQVEDETKRLILGRNVMIYQRNLVTSRYRRNDICLLLFRYIPMNMYLLQEVFNSYTVMNIIV